MKKVYLCGHTGSENHGCEAILRSTCRILNEIGINDICILTHDMTCEQRLGIDSIAELIAYPKRSFIIRVISVLRRHLLHDGVWNGRYLYKPLFHRIRSGDIVFNVGGDTYCYGIPYISYALNELAQENCIPTVFWGCSVDERVENDSIMQTDINRYSYIVARESISYGRLQNIANKKQGVFQTCDPAFWLEMQKIELPMCFRMGDTIGINLSPLVIRDCENAEDIMTQNAYTLIDQILLETNYSVCLIPHVYNVECNSEDIRVLRELYKRYCKEPRVSLLDLELSCEQIKYVISKCKFFIGARTHSVIAAYSTMVPALAISYSVKSLGIAKDLLGSEELYAVEWKKINKPDVLWEKFVFLMEHEDEIRERYAAILPEYKQTILTALTRIIEDVHKQQK